jgi:DNA-binding MarR family transcriptional regulator
MSSKPYNADPDEYFDQELEVLTELHRAQGRAGAHQRGAAKPGATDAAAAESGAHQRGAADAAGKRLSQRSIARALGMSVGLTNAILKRLSAKGLVMVRRVNQNNVHYLVTPEGIEEISRRSYRYLRRTIGHVVRYRDIFRAFCREQAAAGTREIVLIGESDLAFILEWSADKEGIAFRHAPPQEATPHRATSQHATPAGAADEAPDRMLVYAETYSPRADRLTVLDIATRYADAGHKADL